MRARGSLPRAMARSPLARAAVARLRQRLCPQRTADPGFADLPPEQAVRMAYNVMLRREPDPTGLTDYTKRLADGSLTHDGLVSEILVSEEFASRNVFPARYLHLSLHRSRQDFIRSLPPADRILDIGGGWKWSAEGALVVMGYPYRFENLVIVELPSDDRHPLYRSQDHDAIETPLGPVRYDYRSMTDLSGYSDSSFDLVYSGQSIEHVSPDEADLTLKEANRVLRPGGFLAVDTPNAAVCRLQQPEFIDADHKVEYTHEEFAAKLVAAGFTLREAKGLNYCGDSVRHGRFSWDEAARNQGIYAAPAECYLLAYLAEKTGG